MYIGPEIMMPLASALAAVTGMALMFWRRLVGAVRAGLQYISAKFSRG